MASMKIKKGDMVKVIAGRDKDKEGKVIAVNKKDNTLLVEGVNMVTKHAKPSMANQQGVILHQEGPIDASNVMFLHKGKATRVGFKMDGDKKVRYAKSTGDVNYDLVKLWNLHCILVSELFDHSSLISFSYCSLSLLNVLSSSLQLIDNIACW